MSLTGWSHLEELIIIIITIIISIIIIINYMNPIKLKNKERDITSLSDDSRVSETALLFCHKNKYSHNMLWRTNANLTSMRYIKLTLVYGW